MNVIKTSAMIKPSGFGLISFFFGLTIGLLISAYVAFYVTKTPVPFLDKVDSISNSEIEKISGMEGGVVVKIAPDDSSIFVQNQIKADSIEKKNEKDSFNVISKIKLPNLQKNDSLLIDSEKEFKNNKTYFLQVGAFRVVEEADRMRARLAFLGFEASIYKKNKKGNVFYRVRLGPFSSSEELNKIKFRLNKNNVKSHAVLINQ